VDRSSLHPSEELVTAAACATEAASRRGRANRNKGANFERTVAKWLREHGGFPGAERGVRNGWRTSGHHSADPYDIVGTPGLLWSLKDTDSSEEQLHRWLREVHDEATRRGLVGLLVWKRRGSSAIERQWCYRIVEMEGVEVAVRTHLFAMIDVLHAQGYGHDPVTGVRA
jgi:hypothetical protein